MRKGDYQREVSEQGVSETAGMRGDREKVSSEINIFSEADHIRKRTKLGRNRTPEREREEKKKERFMRLPVINDGRRKREER